MDMNEHDNMIDNHYERHKRGRKKKAKVVVGEDKLMEIWDSLYHKLKTNTTEEESIKIFITINFMTILRARKESFIGVYDSSSINLATLCEDVERYFYINKIKVNLYEDILKDYNRYVFKNSLDLYIRNFLEVINDYENIEEKLKVYMLTRLYGNTTSTVKSSYNLIILIKELLRSVEFESIYDPAIGTGNLISEIIKNHNVKAIEGQDISEFEVNVTKMQLILNGRESAANNIYVGNSIVNPMNVTKEKLKKFDCIVCNPPLNGEWGVEVVKDNDKYNRFYRGIPPKNLPSFAFITHIIESLNDSGIGLVVVPNGVLFRDGSEQTIRKSIVEEGIVDTIIYLPHNMMEGTSNPVNIMILNKGKKTKDVFIIDLTKYGTNKNGKIVLSEEFIYEIVGVYESKLRIDNMAEMVPYEKIRDNDFTLYNKRYISKCSDEVDFDFDIDFDEISSEIIKIKNEIAEVNSELYKIMMS